VLFRSTRIQARDVVIADHAAGHDRRRVIMLAAA
jgi:hypothetical protein